MELRQLRYFLAVAEDLHFTHAAERLHVAQPALSQQISQLEREVGVKLLERTSRHVVLTSAGEVFRRRASIAIEQLERAAADAGTIGRGEAGLISLGFISAAVVQILPVMLRWFRHEIPAALIDLRELEPSDQIESIRQRHLDIGLLHGSIQAPELATMVVAREKLVVALPESHPAACKEQIELKSLSKETIFLPRRHAFPGYYELVIHACQREGFEPACLQPTNLLQTAVALVAGELGVALVPESFRCNLPVRGVVYRPIAEPAPVAEMIAVWREDNESPLLAMFRGGLAKVVQEGSLAHCQAA
jgi:DNA-binding transcriptional LysR family regulator